jgi:hypothetical protein
LKKQITPALLFLEISIKWRWLAISYVKCKPFSQAHHITHASMLRKPWNELLLQISLDDCTANTVLTAIVVF